MISHLSSCLVFILLACLCILASNLVLLETRLVYIRLLMGKYALWFCV